MPPNYEQRKDQLVQAKAAPPAPGKANPSSSAALRSKIGNDGMRALAEKQMLAGLKAQSPLMPDWVLRAVVISKSEEQRSRQEWQKDGLKGSDAGHNDIYDAERHGRWMYRLTREVSLWAGTAIGELKEIWGLLKGAGGAETAMDLYNNEIGRKAALEGKPIPSRHTSGELIFLDPLTQKPTSNDGRLSSLRATARGKLTAAAAQGVAAARRIMDRSGGTWWHANQAKYPNSVSLQDLAPPFREKVIRFYDALKAAGASITISSTLRDSRRAYLMHYSWRISKGTIDPAAVPPHPDVDIVWDHGDVAASRAAAQQMKALFRMKYIAALNSIHIEGRAIDMTIGWSGTISVMDATGIAHAVGAPTNGAFNRQLHKIGASYGVIKLLADEPHWSATGG